MIDYAEPYKTYREPEFTFADFMGILFVIGMGLNLVWGWINGI